MDEERPTAALSGIPSHELAHELTQDFIKVRRDCVTATLERASAGKFVETFVQCLQYMASGNFTARPNVDDYLDRHAENQANVPEGLRVCAARMARAVYTLRNKRNIAHKNPIDPNGFDLNMCHAAVAWIMAEMLRNASGLSMQKAGNLISLVQAPAGTLVEEIDGTRLVHAKVPVGAEILILLHSHYPERLTSAEFGKSMIGRDRSSIRKKLAEMKKDKLIQGDPTMGYRLTAAGFDAALHEIKKATA